MLTFNAPLSRPASTVEHATTISMIAPVIPGTPRTVKSVNQWVPFALQDSTSTDPTIALKTGVWPTISAPRTRTDATLDPVTTTLKIATARSALPKSESNVFPTVRSRRNLTNRGIA